MSHSAGKGFKTGIGGGTGLDSGRVPGGKTGLAASARGDLMTALQASLWRSRRNKGRGEHLH